MNTDIRTKKTFTLYDDSFEMLRDIAHVRYKKSKKHESMSVVICDGIKKIWEEEVNNKGE